MNPQLAQQPDFQVPSMNGTDVDQAYYARTMAPAQMQQSGMGLQFMPTTQGYFMGQYGMPQMMPAADGTQMGPMMQHVQNGMPLPMMPAAPIPHQGIPSMINPHQQMATPAMAPVGQGMESMMTPGPMPPGGAFQSPMAQPIQQQFWSQAVQFAPVAPVSSQSPAIKEDPVEEAEREETPPVSRKQSRGSAKDYKKDNHSCIEKQRRDRLNSLIDRLRNLVTNPDTEADSKQRSKHQVLEDTVALIEKLQAQDKERSQKDGVPSSSRDAGESNAADGENANDAGGNGIIRGDSKALLDGDYSVTSRSSTPMVAGVQDDGQPNATRVTVTTEEDGFMRVQVECPDRQGLLWDIITSLKNSYLYIVQAVASTQPNGMAKDVFQVQPHAQHTVTPEDVHKCVMRVLNEEESSSGEKRRRALDTSLTGEWQQQAGGMAGEEVCVKEEDKGSREDSVDIGVGADGEAIGQDAT